MLLKGGIGGLWLINGGEGLGGDGRGLGCELRGALWGVEHCSLASGWLPTP